MGGGASCGLCLCMSVLSLPPPSFLPSRFFFQILPLPFELREMAATPDVTVARVPGPSCRLTLTFWTTLRRR